jgi:hypothetical protein
VSRHLHASTVSRARNPNVGELVLFAYLACVVSVAVIQRISHWPIISELASSPALLMQGQWWRLFTSGLVIQGPAVPQILTIAVLGMLGIYIGGSWLFWRTAVAGHVVGTMVAYAVFSGMWLTDHAVSSQFLTDPDFGVSLVWCAGLGAFAALTWLGRGSSWGRPVHPLLAIAAIVVMTLVTAYSDPMAAVQHFVAFLVGFGIMATADRSTLVSGTPRPWNRWLQKR